MTGPSVTSYSHDSVPPSYPSPRPQPQHTLSSKLCRICLTCIVRNPYASTGRTTQLYHEAPGKQKRYSLIHHERKIVETHEGITFARVHRTSSTALRKCLSHVFPRLQARFSWVARAAEGLSALPRARVHEERVTQGRVVQAPERCRIQYTL